MKKFRILSIDGGGLRGIIPVLIMKEIERRRKKKIYELFDLVTGTSTGGLITCGITVSDNGATPKYTLEDIEKIYVERGKEIFPKSSWLGRVFGSVNALKNPKYSDRGLDKVLKDLLGNKKVSDCIKPILVPSYDLNNNDALFFKSRHATDPARNASLYDVCRATSAAPTYLPAYEFTYGGLKRVCIDGGVYINNPTVSAIVEAHKFKSYYGIDRFENISVLSLGTGHYTQDIVRKKVSGWGQLDWAVPITDIMMQGVNKSTCYQAEELLEDGNFLRLTLSIDREEYADMADSSDQTRNYLIEKTQKEIIGNKELMDKLDVFLNDNEDGGRPVA